MASYVLSAVTVFGLSSVATWFVRRTARQRGWLVAPRPDRWHREPTALFGGVAIFVALSLGISLVPMPARCPACWL